MPLQSLTKIFEVRRVPVYAHWTLLALGAVILVGAFERPAETLAAWVSFFSVLLLHECGHMYVAQRRGYYVESIELYPILGIARHQQPYDRYDSALIACGGVAAQAIVAIPLIILVSLFGSSRFDAVNVAVGILGYYSVGIAIFNLVPIAPLDGSRAWALVPELFDRVRRRYLRNKNTPGWRGR